jgi:site-specific recombinase XerC
MRFENDCQNAAGHSLRAQRNYAMLAMLFGCGLRRSELVGLQHDEVQMRQGHWAIVDLIGKGGHIRTVPIPAWVKDALDEWAAQAGGERTGSHGRNPLHEVSAGVVLVREGAPFGQRPRC